MGNRRAACDLVLARANADRCDELDAAERIIAEQTDTIESMTTRVQELEAEIRGLAALSSGSDLASIRNRAQALAITLTPLFASGPDHLPNPSSQVRDAARHAHDALVNLVSWL